MRIYCLNLLLIFLPLIYFSLASNPMVEALERRSSSGGKKRHSMSDDGKRAIIIRKYIATYQGKVGPKLDILEHVLVEIRMLERSQSPELILDRLENAVGRLSKAGINQQIVHNIDSYISALRSSPSNYQQYLSAIKGFVQQHYEQCKSLHEALDTTYRCPYDQANIDSLMQHLDQEIEMHDLQEKLQAGMSTDSD